MAILNDALIQLLYTVQLDLSASDIQSLQNNRIEIVPAPGANKYINLINASGYFNYGGTPYTDGSDIILYVGTVDVLPIFTVSTIRSSSSAITMGWQGTNNLFSASGIINKAVSVGLLEQSGTDFSGGNSTIRITLTYQYVSV